MKNNTKQKENRKKIICIIRDRSLNICVYIRQDSVVRVSCGLFLTVKTKVMRKRSTLFVCVCVGVGGGGKQRLTSSALCGINYPNTSFRSV